MTDLAVELLGPFGVRRDGEPVALGSRRTEALFAYLVHTGTVHRRDHLAELLWSHGNATTAPGNLRVLLTNLRKSVGDFVEITRTTATFRPPPSGRAAIDVETFTAQSESVLRQPPETLADKDVRSLRDALGVCRGSFLEGLDLADSVRFDDWLRRERDLIHAHRVTVLVHLVEAELARRDTPAALRHAHELRDLLPLEERSHQLVIQALLQAGDVDGATAQFDRLEHTLQREFGTAPSAQTRLLFAAPAVTGTAPVTVRAASRSSAPRVRRAQPWSAFVGRKAELARLVGLGEEAFAGQGRVVFVSGGLGTGKTSLMRQAVRRLLGDRPDAVALGASCGDPADSGDPCLLLDGLTAQLGGDASGPWLDGPMPVTVAHRIRTARAGWSPPGGAGIPSSSPATVLAGVRALTEVRPVVLVLDNLQWAAPAVVNLVSELAKDARRRHLLVLVSRRPESSPQPADRAGVVSWLVARLRRVCGAALVDLDADEAAGSVTAFVRELVQSEATDLPASAVHTLVQLADGNPLLTAELLRQQVRDGHLEPVGPRLVVRSEPVWPRVPERVALAFDERLATVPVELWPLLDTAALLGEEFAAADLARGCGRDVREVVQVLVARFARDLGLVAPVPGTARYRFRPALLQIHLAAGLHDVQRLLSDDLPPDLALAPPELG